MGWKVGVTADPTLQVGEGRRGLSKEAEWPRFDPSQQASKRGCFPRPLLCKQTQGLGGERSQLHSAVLLPGILWPLACVSPSPGLGAGVGWGQEEC